MEEDEEKVVCPFCGNEEYTEVTLTSDPPILMRQCRKCFRRYEPNAAKKVGSLK